MWNVTWWTKRGPTNYFWKFRQPNHWWVTLLPAGCQIKTDKDFVPLLIRPSTGSHLKFPTVLKLHYDSFFSGRCDIQETLDRIWELYFCPKMTVILSDYVKSCSKCQARKLGRPTKPNITAFPTLANHWKLGIYGQLPVTPSGKSYIFTAADLFSKFLYTVPIANSDALSIGVAIFHLVYTCMYIWST